MRLSEQRYRQQTPTASKQQKANAYALAHAPRRAAVSLLKRMADVPWNRFRSAPIARDRRGARPGQRSGDPQPTPGQAAWLAKGSLHRPPISCARQPHGVGCVRMEMGCKGAEPLGLVHPSQASADRNDLQHHSDASRCCLLIENVLRFAMRRVR